MSGNWIFNTVIGNLLLPPFGLILLLGAGLLLSRQRPRLGTALTLFAVLLLTGLSTGIGAHYLAAPLENRHPALTSTQSLDAQAIVILGGGRQLRAPEYGAQDVPSLTTLGRLRYGAWLQRQTGLPLLVTGGAPEGAQHSEAALMATVLQDDFAVPVRWKEQASDNTAQNAVNSAKMLRADGVTRIVLVTDALHMSRAKRVFEHSGLQVLAAPTVFVSQGHPSFMRWLPNMGALRVSHYALHEWLGELWYRLHQQNPPAFGRVG